MRVGYMDLETWDLQPEFGPIICGVVISMPNDKVTIFRQDEYTKDGRADDMVDDEEIARDIRDFLKEHHIVCGWNSKGFDVPLLNTRLVKHGAEKLGRHLHLDPMYFYRGWRGLNPKSASLENVSSFYDYEQKIGVDPDTWLRARLGNKAEMDQAVERCTSDVRMLKAITERTLDEGLVSNIKSYP